MADTGMTRAEALKSARASLDAGDDTVRLPESERDVIRLALATVGKWRVAVNGIGKTRLLGFDLGEIDVAARWMGITPDARLLDGIGVIERTAMKVLETS